MERQAEEQVNVAYSHPDFNTRLNSNNLLMAWFVSSFTEICEPHLRLVVRPLFEICSLIVFATLWFLQTIH